MTVHDAFPRTSLVGRCGRCPAMIFAHEPHEWADPFTNELMLDGDPHARVYCQRCSSERERNTLLSGSAGQGRAVRVRPMPLC